MDKLYPLKFNPIFKEKIWGGQKIKSILKKDFGALDNCGETWELSGVNDNISIVANGFLKEKSLTEIIATYQSELIGKQVWDKFQTQFPLLIKFLDANQDLSIQVHPHDELAQKRHNSCGKTEMWYILQADENATLITGFNQSMNKEKYLSFFENGKLTDVLNTEKVQKDDVFFLPSGRVHTIGKGILLAEIQQTSDITYRIYDFDRIDKTGNKRELHVDLALDAIDYTFHEEYKTIYKSQPNTPIDLVECPYFITNKLHYTEKVTRNYSSIDSFVIYICIEGALEIHYENEIMTIEMGEVVLLPACIQEITLIPSSFFKMLEVYLPYDKK